MVRIPPSPLLIFLLFGAALVPGPLRGRGPSITPEPFPSSAFSQATDLSPGDLILQAIRSVEAGDSAALEAWQQTLRAPEALGGAREAALGLAAAAWATYRQEEAEGLLDVLLDPGSTVDRITPFAWILRGEVASSRARLAAADSAFQHAIDLAGERGEARARAWALIRVANLRSRLTGDPGVAARLLEEAASLLTPEDPFLRGQLHCVRAGNDPTGVWTPELDARAGMELALEAGIRRLHAACLHVLGSDLLRRGLTDQALTTFGEEQEEQRAIGDASGRAATLQWMGYVLFTLGDYAASRTHLLEAVAEGEASGNLSPVAWAYLSLSGIAVGLGDLAGGVDYLNRAQELLEEQGDQYGLATLRGRRASVAMAVGDRETAREIWETNLEEHRRAGNDVAYLSTLTGLLELALADGDLDGAERILEEARRTSRASGMGAWEVSFHFHESELALKRGDPARARRALERYLLPGQYSVRVYRARMRYAEALAMEGRIAEAARSMETSLDALEAWRSGLDAVGLQRYAFQAGEYVPDPDLGVASVVAAIARGGMVEEAFDLAERQRARSLYERMVLSDIARLRDVAQRPAEETLPSAPEPLRSRAVQGQLPDTATALVEFVTGRGGEPTTAFLLTREGLGAVTLPPVDSLQRDIDLLRSLVESGGDSRPVASRLGKRILNPILETLPEGRSKLVLIPSDALFRIPFDLLEPDSAGPLLQRFDVSVAPSASVMAHLWGRRGEAGEGVLVLGDPMLPPGAGDSGRRPGFPGGASGLPRLPGAAREAAHVAGFSPSSRLLTGAGASEASLRRAPLRDLGVLHLATHAVVNEASAAGSYLLLAPGEGEDGILTPGDVARLPLGPGLVVLSSCRTAGGEVIRGEGVQGLTDPFLQAGAQTVVATLWPTEDLSGRLLMRDLYRGLAMGADVGGALRTAKATAADRGEPPAVWAAFTVVGDAGLQIPGLAAPGPLGLRWGSGTALAAAGLLALLALVVWWRLRLNSR